MVGALPPRRVGATAVLYGVQSAPPRVPLPGLSVGGRRGRSYGFASSSPGHAVEQLAAGGGAVSRSETRDVGTVPLKRWVCVSPRLPDNSGTLLSGNLGRCPPGGRESASAAAPGPPPVRAKGASYPKSGNSKWVPRGRACLARGRSPIFCAFPTQHVAKDLRDRSVQPG